VRPAPPRAVPNQSLMNALASGAQTAGIIRDLPELEPMWWGRLETEVITVRTTICCP
jgi:hypothetical protein